MTAPNPNPNHIRLAKRVAEQLNCSRSTAEQFIEGGFVSVDGQLEEAARLMGASRWAIVRDVWAPSLAPTTLACGAILFATAMGAFGTAFTLASKFEVLPITIYNEFTNYANFALAASLSIALGLMTWLVLFIARRFGGATTAAAAG